MIKMDLEDVFDNPAFYILCGVGLGAFFLMLVVLKGMNYSNIMPWWVKIITLIAIPIGSAFFAGYASGD